MPGTKLKFVQAFYEAFGRGDQPDGTSVFAGELNWVEPPFPGRGGGTLHGKINLVENVLTRFTSQRSNLTVTPD